MRVRTRCRATKPAGLPLERAAIHFAEASRLLKRASLIDGAWGKNPELSGKNTAPGCESSVLGECSVANCE